jgi:hypothetical protein
VPKLTEVQNPITGQKVNVANFKAWPGMILGVVFLLFVWQLGQGIFARLRPLIPGQVSQFMGTGIPAVRQNANSSATPTDTQVGQSVRVF